MQWKKERLELVRYARKIYRKGLVSAISGNLSLRVNERLFLITPKGKCYERLRREDIVLLDLDGNLVDGTKEPSSEKNLHIEVYRNRPDVRAIIHTHSLCACVLAALEMPLPVILDEQMEILGGSIEVTRYSPPGSAELAKEVVRALNDKKAAILSRHGAVSVGSSLKEAYNVCELLERLCRVYIFIKFLRKD